MEGKTNRITDHTGSSSCQFSMSPEPWSDETSTASGDIAELKSALEELNNYRAQLIHNADRMERYLKEKLRKERTSRLVQWGAEFEHQITALQPELKDVLSSLEREQQKELMERIFREESVHRFIVGLIQEYL